MSKILQILYKCAFYIKIIAAFMVGGIDEVTMFLKLAIIVYALYFLCCIQSLFDSPIFGEIIKYPAKGAFD